MQIDLGLYPTYERLPSEIVIVDYPGVLFPSGMVFVDGLRRGVFLSPEWPSGESDEGREHDLRAHFDRIGTMPEIHAKMTGLVAHHGLLHFLNNPDNYGPIMRTTAMLDSFTSDSWNTFTAISPLEHPAYLRLLFMLMNDGREPEGFDLSILADSFFEPYRNQS